MNQLLNLLTLQPLKNYRSQTTAIVALIINALVQLGFLHLTPEQVNTVNDFLLILFGYFFADKMTPKTSETAK